jgi:hypothetical protein
VYHDRPFGLGSGTVLHYSYGLVDGGREVGRSPEVRAVWNRTVPPETVLHPNVPNPFNPITRIRFELARPGEAKLEIFNLSGRRLRTLVDGFLPAAAHQFEWDGRDDSGRAVASGAYHFRLRSEGSVLMRRMLLLR